MFNAEEHNIITTNVPQRACKLLTMLSCNRTTLLNKYDCRLKHVTDIEDKLDIPAGGQWTLDHPKQLEMVAWVNMRDYHATLDALESLVVQHLFELTLLNVNGTGEPRFGHETCSFDFQ